MELIQPDSWANALAAKAAHPDAIAIQGGTDVMVELNFDRHRPPAIIDLGRVAELSEWRRDGDEIRLGAGVTYTRVIQEIADELPGLAIASRAVGSPQIRNRGTVGGNLGAASPAGDSHPPLMADRATVELASADGMREVPIDAYYVGPKQSALRPDELIAAVRIPVAGGPQQFAKIGARNAMVIAACSLSVHVDRVRRRIGVGIGSAGPRPLRATEAESFLAGALEELGGWDSPTSLGAATLDRFGELVAAAASPIDDVRSTRAYRLHALLVLARRLATWTCGAAPFETHRNGDS
jgi:CO/xanthine dehydrogenase FAD-binding subunit